MGNHKWLFAWAIENNIPIHYQGQTANVSELYERYNEWCKTHKQTYTDTDEPKITRIISGNDEGRVNYDTFTSQEWAKFYKGAGEIFINQKINKITRENSRVVSISSDKHNFIISFFGDYKYIQINQVYEFDNQDDMDDYINYWED